VGASLKNFDEISQKKNGSSAINKISVSKLKGTEEVLM
jgi:hypothetical protein